MGGYLEAVNCTIVDNSAALGGGLYADAVTPPADNTLANVVVWGNWPDQIVDEGGAMTIAEYCDIADGWPGAGNVNADPLFSGGHSGAWTADAVFDPDTFQTTFYDDSSAFPPCENLFLNPDTSQYLQSLVVANDATSITVWGDFASLGLTGNAYRVNDYHLDTGSPCIDTGDPAVLPPGGSDLDGLMRVWDGDGDDVARVDMGCYEYDSHRFGDMNCDDAINTLDIEAFVMALTDPDGYETTYPDCDLLLADLNGDDSVNSLDIEAFVSLLTGS
jgi:hypothetical protein